MPRLVPMTKTALIACSFLAILSGPFCQADVVTDSIKTLQSVGPEGKGNAQAAAAWQTLTSENAEALIPLLASIETAPPLARNWISSAAEVIFEKQKEAGAELPAENLRSFLLETTNDPHARTLAFDMYAKVNPDKANDLIPGMISDPSTSLRRKAVALLIDEGKQNLDAGKKPDAISVLQKALDSARDIDQIKEIAGLLREKLEQTIDLPKHFGFLMRWQTIAPFDNTERAGFDTVYPPEKEVDLAASYKGKEGDVSWQETNTSDDYGMLDFNKPYDPLKQVVGYAYTEFESETNRSAEIRLGCKNAWKIWFNGELLFGRDEYHRGARIDQYTLPIELKKGKNTILVKCCQNEQEQDWTVQWEFQLRVCDSSGTAILSTDRKPTPAKQAPPRRRGNNDEDAE